MSDPVEFVINEAKPAPKVKADKAPGTFAKPAAKAAPSTATTADVRKAMAALDTMYNFVSMGLMMFGLTETASEWADSADTLKSTNEEALKAAPKLAKTIANFGETGGSSAFVITHVLAIGGVVRIGMKEVASKTADKEERTERASEVQFITPNEERDPTLIPGT